MSLQRVLLPLDGSGLSEGIVPCVSQVAKALGLKVTIFYVTALEEAASGQPTLTRLPQGAKTTVSAYLADMEEAVVKQGVTAVDSVMTAGVPSVEIVRYADENGYDLIAMATHGRSGVGRWVYGSTTDNVLHSTALPMLLLRYRETSDKAQKTGPIQTVIVPLDGSPLAEAVLPVAEQVAMGMDLDVSLIRVLPSYASAYAGMDPYTSDYDPKFDERIERSADEYLENKEEGLQMKQIHVASKCVRGDPADQIIDFAGKKGGAMIVMSSHGRSGMGRWVMGGVADRVLRASNSPVLVIRPQGTAEQDGS